MWFCKNIYLVLKNNTLAYIKPKPKKSQISKKIKILVPWAAVLKNVFLLLVQISIFKRSSNKKGYVTFFLFNM